MVKRCLSQNLFGKQIFITLENSGQFSNQYIIQGGNKKEKKIYIQTNKQTKTKQRKNNNKKTKKQNKNKKHTNTFNFVFLCK